MKNTKILIVEDDGTIVVRLERLLRAWGYDVVSVGSGEAALQLADEHHPDLALMDIRLDEGKGVIDGIDTAQELRTRFEIPSIYLTAYADEEFLQQARETEPYGYLVKPLQELSLRSTLDMAVAKCQVDRRLKALLQEREVLIQEIHHRVKNNMLAITSLLNIMEDSIQDEQALRVLQEGENRIRAMATVHQMLYQADDLTHINFHDYATDIVYNLFHSYGVPTHKVSPVIEIEDISLAIDVALPCGLLINELASNSLKYAFPGDRTGRLTVAMHPFGEGHELIVSDTGVGLPDGLEVEKTESLGLSLVTAWTHQLLGKLIIDRPEKDGTEGTRFRLVFTRKR